MPAAHGPIHHANYQSLPFPLYPSPHLHPHSHPIHPTEGSEAKCQISIRQSPILDSTEVILESNFGSESCQKSVIIGDISKSNGTRLNLGFYDRFRISIPGICFY